jgi:hypothetical protein
MKFATVSIEPSGVRYACKYSKESREEALEALRTMGGGVTLLRVSDPDNWNQLPEWEYFPGIGWVY